MFGGDEDYLNKILSPEDIPEEKRNEILGELAQKVVDRKLVVPAIMFLESLKPLSFIGSQMMVMANPFVQLLFNSKAYWQVTVLLEDRKNVEYLIQELERRSNEGEEGSKENSGN
ncbi:MAG: hypothetical protein U9N06_03045 [candidate division WOR-3 bacterium]|nr:hypothetical protein [candidate division WOR-3 bacterium]